MGSLLSRGGRVLVIDEKKPIGRSLRAALVGEGYDVARSHTGRDGLDQAATFHPDLIILELDLPDMDGVELIHSLREWTGTPIIVLSGRNAEKDKIAALDAGADDYVCKPFSTGELLARVRVGFRHIARSTDEPVLTFGDLTMDLACRFVTVRGKEVRLTPIEYDILKYLALQGGKVLTHKHLLRLIWGPKHQEELHYLRVYIGHLRRKIEMDASRPLQIITEQGIGYRLAI